MTQNTGIPSKYTKTLALSGTGVLALALLTGCSVDDGGAQESDSGTAATAETTPTTATDDSGTPTASPGTSTGEATTTGEDPVFAALEALLAEHSDAVVVQVDRDDDDTVYEIEAVLGDRVVDFDVLPDGSVREDDDDDDDDDDVRRAQEATVTAEEAARAALEGRDGQTIDDMELDEDDGTLRWEVDLDRDGGDDGDELSVDAATGEVTEND